MLTPLVAALACALSAPAAPRAGAPAPATPAMSLPLDAGPASLLTELMSLPAPEPADAPMTPATVDCVDLTAPAPAPDCTSGPASRWTADMIGSCDLPRAGARTVALERARPRAGGTTVDAGRIAAAPDPIAPDHQPPIPLPGVRVALLHARLTSSPPPRASDAPPSPPARRIDRPPRA